MDHNELSEISAPSEVSAPPAIALADEEHRFVAVTAAFASVIGYTPEELFGKTFEEFTHPADADVDGDLCRRMFRGELDAFDMTKRYIHKDGHYVRILLSVTCARGKNGTIQYAVAQIRPLGGLMPGATMPAFQHADEPNDEVDRIKRAMFF